jgi:hypothetical protein
MATRTDHRCAEIEGVDAAGRQVERADPDDGERKNRRGVFLTDLPAALPTTDSSATDGT